MRIVDRTAFLAMPPGTVYAKYEPCIFGELSIKGESLRDEGRPAAERDFYCQSISDAIAAHDSGEWVDLLDRSAAEGISLAMDFDCPGRDALYEADVLFAVWEPSDVQAFVARLERAALDAAAAGTAVTGENEEAP